MGFGMAEPGRRSSIPQAPWHWYPVDPGREKRLESLGCTKINLQVVGSNDAVTGFYRRLGYTIEDRISMGKRVEHARY